MRLLLAIAALASLSACASSEEKLCRASIKADLLNPETAEFSDFTSYTPEQIKSDVTLSAMPEIMENLMPTEGASYFGMRLRAEGELGNKITKIQFCAVDQSKKNCACISRS